ncbi:hypothetical protein KIW84_UN0062 [Lathyrus oleraceus]|nr:hypothetical protein KIW84_UN0062 [Pisum sativum]
MCRRFIWAGNDEKSKRAPVAWDHVCDSIANGGRNIYALGEWNKATIGKLLWSLSEKKDNANDRYSTRRMYQHLRGDKPRVDWRRLMYINMARPRLFYSLAVCDHKEDLEGDSHRLGLEYIHIDWNEHTAWQQAKGRATKCASSKLRWPKRFTTLVGEKQDLFQQGGRKSFKANIFMTYLWIDLE